MRVVWSGLLSIVLVAGGASAQDEPVALDLTERVEVNLVMIDTLVLDRQGRTVGDLTRDDFRLSVQGRARQIDTFDIVCPESGFPEPSDTTSPENVRPKVGTTPERRLVLAYDYHHLSHGNRAASLEWGQLIAQRDMSPGDGIMVVALADGLRIEQGFTGAPGKVYHTLDRMLHDVTLYARQFQPLTERTFLDSLATLADVLSQYPGPKAVVLFSEWGASASDQDTWFMETAEHAAAGRTAFYPVWAAGIGAGGPVGGSAALARLANESGGRFTRNTNDLTLAYAKAQRDLTCRYAIGYYVDPDAPRKGRTVQVRVNKGGYEVRAAERIRLWSDAERQRSMLRAAFADPGPNDDPLMRAYGYPFRPMSAKSWETLLAVSFPLHVEPEGEKRLLGASIDAAHLNLDAGSMEIEIPGLRSGESGVRPVTIYGARKLKPGPHTLTVTIAEPGEERVRTSKVDFMVPEVPKDTLVVRGPLIVRVDRDGFRMRVDDKAVAASQLDDLIGDAGFVPLLVSQIKPTDSLVAGWHICAVGKGPPAEATIERRITAEGEIVHRLDPIPLALEGKKKLRCQGALDEIPAGTLPVGRYRFEVAVYGGEGQEIALGFRPLSISGKRSKIGVLPLGPRIGYQ
jgi:VWFA-related protein